MPARDPATHHDDGDSSGGRADGDPQDSREVVPTDAEDVRRRAEAAERLRGHSRPRRADPPEEP
jgi:hypothetical protein